MRTQDFAVELRGQHDVVSKLCLTGALRARVDLSKRLADYFQWLPVFVPVLMPFSSKRNLSNYSVSQVGKVVYPRLSLDRRRRGKPTFLTLRLSP